jgi:hypothetical protein
MPIYNESLPFVRSDGGRAKAGRGKSGDCVTRAIAVATGRPYAEVYAELAEINASMRLTKLRKRGKVGSRTAGHGIYTQSKLFKAYMLVEGFEWTPTMGIGTGCRVHMRQGELPMGRLVVMLSRHAAAVIDGVVYDTADPSRGGTRCVYGYYKLS